MRPIAVRSLWHMAQALSYDPRPSSGRSEAALTPFLVTAINQAASNQTVGGVRVSWKTVPASTRTRLRQPPHDQPPGSAPRPPAFN